MDLSQKIFCLMISFLHSVVEKSGSGVGVALVSYHIASTWQMSLFISQITFKFFFFNRIKARVCDMFQ